MKLLARFKYSLDYIKGEIKQPTHIEGLILSFAV